MLIFALVALPGVASAQEGTPEERRACRGDFVKFCQHIPDQQKIDIANCLAAHRPPPGTAHSKRTLSEACDAVLRSHGF
jgi:hypothetical protein